MLWGEADEDLVHHLHLRLEARLSEILERVSYGVELLVKTFSVKAGDRLGARCDQNGH